MQCHQIRVIDGKLIKTKQYHMLCSHEEADTRMIFHTKCINGGKVVVIRNKDTDVLNCFLANFHLLDSSLKIWLEVGVEGSKSLRYIDLTKLHSKLGWKFCMALAAFHAFTGCDYCASFYRKGKLKALKILSNSEEFQDMSGRWLWSARYSTISRKKFCAKCIVRKSLHL